MSDRSGHKRVLIVSYLFPPVGGVGVLRVAKFVKYLPDFGWRSSVLTASNPSVPLMDDSLLGEIPDGTVICKARTLEPGYRFKSSVARTPGPGTSGPGSRTKSFINRTLKRAAKLVLQPDSQILWYPAAIRQGMRVLQETPHHLIIASGPPFTNLVVGAALSRRTGVPLLLDYRDEWGISNAYWENKQHGRFSTWIQTRLQRRALRAASGIVATTPAGSRALGQLASDCGSPARATHVFNGFDPADFPARDDPTQRTDFGNGTDRYRLTFTGTLWELTSIAPFVAGVERLAASSPALVEQLEVVIAGRRAGQQDEWIDRLSCLPCKVVKLGYLEHREVTPLMMTSDALLLLLSDVPEANRVISSKVFEYMAARRPVFSVSPEGDQTDVLREHPGSILCSPGRPDQIADALAHELEAHRCGMEHPIGDWDLSRFERRTQTRLLADFMESIAHRAGNQAQDAFDSPDAHTGRRFASFPFLSPESATTR